MKRPKKLPVKKDSLLVEIMKSPMYSKREQRRLRRLCNPIPEWIKLFKAKRYPKNMGNTITRLK